MKLITHNMLTSNIIKGVTKGYPLKIVAKEIDVKEEEFNSEAIARLIPRIEWQALYQAADSIGHLGDLPKEPVEHYGTCEEFLKKAHHVLLEVDIKEGELVCPETGRKFTVRNGIPNMLLHEDEV
ncbi:multifunctional methyltransferase subunit TRM112-like protein [Lineus longissimus]|uniref:multifunctional methyltransferase subunit TRM112-like protein n=1 Tax=Lineus longissimus TaxID=88925 RepID=UPI002B4D6B36